MMEDKKKCVTEAKKAYVKPELKTYSVKDMLTKERLQEALTGMRRIQTDLWNDMDSRAYEPIERVFDTAIASMMAHLLEIEPIKREAAAGAGQDAAQPVLQSAT